MKGKRLTLVAFLAVLFMFGTTPSVFAADDLNCSDFDTQPEAQAHLDADPSDPDGLDRDKDGIACENLPQGDSTASNNDANESEEASEDTSTDESTSSEDAAASEEETSSEDATSTEEASSSDDEATSDESASSDEEGGELPNTATALPLGILGGLGAMILGGLGLRKRQ
ncbi:excalibur calcium-binding domain-containing protein [Oceanobacillus oncorhynchi]|uniref:excalibur calcium-binding domain-containing protein n=1 Tax=Oceanobacillus oncorhynchi TaxID=545501 RepID=UPI002116DBDE|nr:excalibur calcium-binding domain-containing protein [Oceanobacillus oncorhynchi]UUI39441.1 excalibur calcium-binding domain-containing protein [Oceanobacillus oncorhynchi]